MEKTLAALAADPTLLRRLQAEAPWLQEGAVSGLSRW